MGDKKIAETVDMLVAEGTRRGASAVHIEPHERFVLVRYRVDGALRGVHKLPRQTHGAIIAELKKRAGLDDKEIRMPQEGEFANMRLATMPVFGGEKAVLHLSAERGDIPSLEEIGFEGDGLKTLQNAIAQPHGLVIVSAPLHNGTSSTLFSLLEMLNSPLHSVATIEQSPTHSLPGVAQTYLYSGVSSHQALAAALKQDANIVMLDGLDHNETAKQLVHAASTGHLILAGMHAEGAVAAVVRLLHASSEPYLLTNSLKAATCQRLVRGLCTCRQHYEISLEERRQLEGRFNLDTPAARKRFANLTHLWRADENGCETCDHTGYKGRIAITEVLKPGEAVHKVILAREVPTLPILQEAAIKDGFIPMAWDGLFKVSSGQTSVAELFRVI